MKLPPEPLRTRLEKAKCVEKKMRMRLKFSSSHFPGLQRSSRTCSMSRTRMQLRPASIADANPGATRAWTVLNVSLAQNKSLQRNESPRNVPTDVDRYES